MRPLRKPFITLGIALGALCAIAPAVAQSFQTALPLSPAERRALEARLSTILDYADTNEISEFGLPTGRTVTVRPYEMVRRPNGPPCRGYRIDLLGSAGRTAVDGFRCRRNDGRAWAIVEPELVLVREEGPLDLGALDDPFSPGSRAPEEPIYGDDGPFADEPAARATRKPPPLPRPAPRRPVVAALPDAADETPPPAEPAPQTDAAAAPVSTAAQTPAAIPEPQVVAAPANPPADGSTDTPAAGPEVPPPDGNEPWRVVDRPASAQRPRLSENSDIVAALRRLDYLGETDTPTEAAVTAAVDDFALDERFALPIAPDTLLKRLDAAVERSASLPACGPDTGRAPCLRDG